MYKRGLLFFLIFCVQCTYIYGESVWKDLYPGLEYCERYDSSLKQRVHAYRFSLDSKYVKLRSVLANTTIFPSVDQKHSDRLSNIVQKYKGIGGVNGDFFPLVNGVPLGAMICNQHLIRKPFPNRSVLAWGDKKAVVSKLRWRACLVPELGSNGETERPIWLTGYNEACGINQSVLFTPISGRAVAKLPNLLACFEMKRQKWTPVCRSEGVFKGFYVDQLSAQVPKGHVIIAANGTARAQLEKLRKGQRVTLFMKTEGLDWKEYPHAIGGGPTLCKDGICYVDWESQNFRPDIYRSKRSRTAVGITQDEKLILAVVEKRPGVSQGANLMDLARVMKNLGCRDAMNLDGGGSSTFNLFGITLNCTEDGCERRIANSLLFFAPNYNHKELIYSIEGPNKVLLGDGPTYQLMRSDGVPAPHNRVVWHTSKKGIFDAYGKLTPLDQGTLWIEAIYYGKRFVKEVLVQPKEASLE